MASGSDKLDAVKQKPKYVDTLEQAVRNRYLEKVNLVGRDPYEISASEWSYDVSLLPDVTYPDIVNYLVFQQSAYTVQQLKAYKSLEAYNYFVSGWVKEVKQRVDNGLRLVSGRVIHSQRPNVTPLRPWFIATSDGTVKAGHCDCMAGLGEVCSHIGALLFSVEVVVRIRNSKTVTQEKAYWLLPSGLQKLDYKPVREIDFTSAKTKKRVLDKLVTDCLSQAPGDQTLAPSAKKLKFKQVAAPTADELTNFYTLLEKSSSKPALLSVIPRFCTAYVPNAMSKEYPKVLNDLENVDCLEMSKNELLEHCKNVTVTVSNQEAEYVESTTREQARCKEWHRFRAGRITASKFKAVCRTSIDNPSHSLIKSICYPHTNKFSTVATRWGCDHEKEALQRYTKEMCEIHDGFEVHSSGLVINPIYPYIGASPDGISRCKCCGVGCIEIKCPFCAKEMKIKDYVGPKSCLENIDGQTRLKRDHEYYFQVQCQLFVCQKDFCDFVVFTENDLHWERIEPDTDFWQIHLQKAKLFFQEVLLLELVGKYFTRPFRQSLALIDNKPSSENKLENDASQSGRKICLCHSTYNNSDKVVVCDNENCVDKLFHFQCVKIQRSQEHQLGIAQHAGNCLNSESQVKKKKILVEDKV